MSLDSPVSCLTAIAVAALLLGAGGGVARAGGKGEAKKSDAATDSDDHGGGGEIVGILSFAADGVSPTAAKMFEDAIEKSLADNGFGVAPRKRLTEMLANSSYKVGCTFGPCLVEVHRNTDLRLVLVARVHGVGPSYSFVFSLLDTRVGRTTSQVTDLCDVCTLEEAVTTASLTVVALVTGAGSAVVDPSLGPTSRDKLPDLRGQIQHLDREVSRRRRRLRQAAVFFYAVAALAGGTGAYFLSKSYEHRGYPLVGGAGAFVVAGTTCLVLSRRF